MQRKLSPGGIFLLFLFFSFLFPFIPEAFYLRKRLYVIGLIKEYKGSPEIIVRHHS
ncbi:MAG: hypothetical protein HXS54_09130 [Theionarchaea archaeon]|nr:hypothetical protein [Theionarchaea archaeon]